MNGWFGRSGTAHYNIDLLTFDSSPDFLPSIMLSTDQARNVAAQPKVAQHISPHTHRYHFRSWVLLYFKVYTILGTIQTNSTSDSDGTFSKKHFLISKYLVFWLYLFLIVPFKPKGAESGPVPVIQQLVGL